MFQSGEWWKLRHALSLPVLLLSACSTTSQTNSLAQRGYDWANQWLTPSTKIEGPVILRLTAAEDSDSICAAFLDWLEQQDIVLLNCRFLNLHFNEIHSAERYVAFVGVVLPRAVPGDLGDELSSRGPPPGVFRDLRFVKIPYNGSQIQILVRALEAEDIR